MIQPFKNITIVMKGNTNNGMIDGTKVLKENGGTQTSVDKVLPVESFRMQDDVRFTPVVLDADGYGVSLAQETSKHGAVPTDCKGAVIGILMESFDKKMYGHEVMIHGICSMQAKETIEPGIPVYWDSASKKLTKTKTSSSGSAIYYVGLSLSKAATANDMLDVLIGR